MRSEDPKYRRAIALYSAKDSRMDVETIQVVRDLTATSSHLAPGMKLEFSFRQETT
jgi:hypothetical protein